MSWKTFCRNNSWDTVSCRYNDRNVHSEGVCLKSFKGLQRTPLNSRGKLSSSESQCTEFHQVAQLMTSKQDKELCKIKTFYPCSLKLQFQCSVTHPINLTVETRCQMCNGFVQVLHTRHCVGSNPDSLTFIDISATKIAVKM